MGPDGKKQATADLPLKDESSPKPVSTPTSLPSSLSHGYHKERISARVRPPPPLPGLRRSPTPLPAHTPRPSTPRPPARQTALRTPAISGHRALRGPPPAAAAASPARVPAPRRSPPIGEGGELSFDREHGCWLPAGLDSDTFPIFADRPLVRGALPFGRHDQVMGGQDAGGPCNTGKDGKRSQSAC
ncbi:pistil-specific extensin-like protein [Dipodomys spectabilis]|uniref:pistil-specific extensin-like protein n=1 Tax=Dipodomys spectabilis TaxID=105255 RepID=UPI001C53556D|nr:pistil-specific extensin-like protein [Dipodomys spectabilis]